MATKIDGQEEDKLPSRKKVEQEQSSSSRRPQKQKPGSRAKRTQLISTLNTVQKSMYGASTFVLSETSASNGKMNNKELEKLKVFTDKHNTKGKKHPFVSFSLHFIGTTIGMHLMVECKHCGKKEDITDYEAW